MNVKELIKISEVIDHLLVDSELEDEEIMFILCFLQAKTLLYAGVNKTMLDEAFAAINADTRKYFEEIDDIINKTKELN